MSAEQKKEARGIRNVATLQTLSYRGQPRDRHQAANRFARLENERARLEREYTMWETRKTATLDRLATVLEEIEALRPLLMDAPAKQPVHRQGRGRARARATTEVASPSRPPNRNLAIEY